MSATQSSDRVIRFGHNDFTNPTKIDNKWLPLIPGTQFTLEGRANQGGVPTLVLWDRDFDEDELTEEELAFEAQDSDGNVWNLGEYSEEYEDGVFLGAPNTWIAGLAGAIAGIHVS